jgi:hypothetical protein
MGTVTVACKLPNGVILELKGKGRVTVRGNAVEALPPTVPGERRRSVQPLAPALIVSGGYALTPDVDEDFWNAWVETYAGLEIVEKGIIYALPRAADARAKSREMGDLKTGLEPIDPGNMGPGLERVGA